MLLPEFTVRWLGGDARTLAFRTAASGLGALTGALFLASRKSVLGLDCWILLALTLLGLGLLAFVGMADFTLALLALFTIGFCMMVEMAASNTLVQTIVAEDKRGRVMSFYTMAFLGMAPLGSLLTGALAPWLGLPIAFLINGLLCLAGTAFFGLSLPRLRALVRPIYVRLMLGFRFLSVRENPSWSFLGCRRWIFRQNAFAQTCVQKFHQLSRRSHDRMTVRAFSLTLPSSSVHNRARLM